MATVTKPVESSLIRSSAVMALGTVASRATGFVRTAVLAFALGTKLLADAYNTANTIPNIVYDLLLGGILTSVVVPLLVRARREHADRGVAYEQRMFTIVTLLLAAITVVAVALAGPLISLYGSDFAPAQRDLAVVLARFFLPQIFFYGVGAFAGAVLNTRGSFAAPMWTPVLNNVIVTGVGLLFLAVTDAGVDPGTITPAEVQLLGFGTTAGIVAQTVALWPSLRAVGFRFRPRFDFRNAGLADMGRMAGWTLVYVVATQIAFAVTTNIANRAGAQAAREGVAHGAGFTPYTYAYQLFQLPYAIIAVSVITALLPRMSEHAAAGDAARVREDFSTGLRVSAVLLVPTAVFMLVLGPAITVALFAHFRTSQADAIYLGEVLRVFAVGVLPFSIFQLMLRVFYALKDTRTPALISVGYVAVNIAGNLAAYALLPPRLVAGGLATSFWLSYAVACLPAWLILRRRVGGLDGRRVWRALWRLHLATVPGVVFAVAMTMTFTGIFGYGLVTASLTVVSGAGVGGLLYLLFARRLGAEEVTSLLGIVRGRLRGGA